MLNASSAKSQHMWWLQTHPPLKNNVFGAARPCQTSPHATYRGFWHQVQSRDRYLAILAKLVIVSIRSWKGSVPLPPSGSRVGKPPWRPRRPTWGGGPPWVVQHGQYPTPVFDIIWLHFFLPLSLFKGLHNFPLNSKRKSEERLAASA